MDKDDKLKLTPKSLMALLTLIAENSKQDREFALAAKERLERSIGEVGILEAATMQGELAEAVERFLRTSTTSTGNLIKVAKILSEYIVKYQEDDGTLDDEEISDVQSEFGDFMTGLVPDGPDSQ